MIRSFAGNTTRRLFNNSSRTLGIKNVKSDMTSVYRKPELDLLDAYYEGRQYSALPPWDNTNSEDGEYVPVRQRAPRLSFNFAKILASRLTSKLLGKKNFPQIKIEQDPETVEYLNLVLSTSQLRSKLMEPMRRTINTGSCFVRFSIVEGSWKINHYLSKWCYPEFDQKGELEKIEIKYVYDDHEDKDGQGNPKKKWYKEVLTKDKDTLYDNPEYKQDDKPDFKVVGSVDHGLGFVQGEWLVTTDKNNDFDGEPILADIMGFIDELNYSLSQSSTAIQYNQDPQLVFSNMDEEELGDLVRSSFKAWNLGREGDAKFLESGMSGVEAAVIFRDKIKLSLQDISRIVMLDPEKMASHAQSGKAMEVLHGPFVELIEEMQPQVEKHLRNLLLKMALTNGVMNSLQADVPITLPPGYAPKSLNILFSFPDVFPQTSEDLQKKVMVAVSAANASIISRESMTRWLAKDFDIVDIEEELQKIETQPVINPFGAF